MDMNLHNMKEIFGNIPIDHLPSTQALATKRLNRNIFIGVGVFIFAAGLYLGYKAGKNTVKLKVKPPENNSKSSNEEQVKSSSIKSFSNPMGFMAEKKEIKKHVNSITDQLPKAESNILSENKSDKTLK